MEAKRYWKRFDELTRLIQLKKRLDLFYPKKDLLVNR